jgi:hypothetical protein
MRPRAAMRPNKHGHARQHGVGHVAADAVEKSSDALKVRGARSGGEAARRFVAAGWVITLDVASLRQ